MVAYFLTTNDSSWRYCETFCKRTLLHRNAKPEHSNWPSKESEQLKVSTYKHIQAHTSTTFTFGDEKAKSH